MNKNNRITYRFDRTGQSVEDKGRNEISAKPQQAPEREQGKPSNIVPLYAKTEYETAESPFSPWMSPFQEDVSALEDLIRETDPKPVPAAEKMQAAPAALPVTKPKLVQDSAVLDSQPEPGQTAKQPQRPAQWHPRQKAQPAAESIPQSEQKSASKSTPPKSVQPEMHAVPMQQESDPWGELQHYPELDLNLNLNNNGQKANRWSGPVHNYSAPPSWIKVFLSVAGALATGALFGYLLLSLFTNTPDQSDSNNKLANPVNGSVTNPSASPSGGKTNTIGGTSSPSTGQTAGRVKLDIPLQSYQLLQYGVFSNTEGRDAAIKELSDKGLAAAGLQTANDYRVYAGMAIDRDRALALSNDLGEDVPVYIKQIDIQVPEQFPFAGDAKSATAFMNNTIGLIGMLDELALTQLEQPSLSPLSSAAAESWKTEYQKWTGSVKAMQAGVTDESGKAFLIKLIQSMNTAAKSLEEYDKKPSQSHLWAVQDALMDAVATQKQWYESINAL
ncbi:SPOR domain-containing protein [Paenibacillus glycanilyticus]|uniref:SPOR domain-containing protein n=1 Tax=Paenibacillus glycanilyticus TaxID=126569 RepID=UPI0019108B93|nr:SPOR domain-containing protein [Paenibacillus glycanilyticus]